MALPIPAQIEAIFNLVGSRNNNRDLGTLSPQELDMFCDCEVCA